MLIMKKHDLQSLGRSGSREGAVESSHAAFYGNENTLFHGKGGYLCHSDL
jgi:hypothetical protein